jgi:mono/diheme cytochrome c family protein
MSSNSDNPLIRFVAFWWALGVFSLFAVALLVAKLFFGGGDPEQNDLEAAAASKRYEAAAKVKSAQDANLAYKEVEAGKVVQVHPHDVFTVVGKDLVSKKAAPLEKTEQIVPGSKRALEEAEKAKAGGPVDPAAVDKLSPPAGTAPDPAVMQLGQTTYALCAACHGANGAGFETGGVTVGPPLAGSEWVTGPASNLIRIQLRGLMGEITVKGKKYNLIMPPTGQTDEATAAVLTYIRNSFGNKAAPVTVEQVKMLRPEAAANPGIMLTEKDLIKP